MGQLVFLIFLSHDYIILRSYFALTKVILDKSGRFLPTINNQVYEILS